MEGASMNFPVHSDIAKPAEAVFDAMADARNVQTVSRYRWTMLTTPEPSPTAAAIRLPDPTRNVAHREDSGDARLEQERVAIERPPSPATVSWSVHDVVANRDARDLMLTGAVSGHTICSSRR
jgi:hypothetical protein